MTVLHLTLYEAVQSALLNTTTRSDGVKLITTLMTTGQATLTSK